MYYSLVSQKETKGDSSGWYWSRMYSNTFVTLRSFLVPSVLLMVMERKWLWSGSSLQHCKLGVLPHSNTGFDLSNPREHSGHRCSTRSNFANLYPWIPPLGWNNQTNTEGKCQEEPGSALPLRKVVTVEQCKFPRDMRKSEKLFKNCTEWFCTPCPQCYQQLGMATKKAVGS